MNITDELLMAYVDDELDPTERAAVEAAVAADPQLQRRVAEQRALRDKLRAAFAPVLEEPVPDRLLEAARSAPEDTGRASAGRIGDLGEKRAQRAATASAARRWALPQWAAMAASMVVGVLIVWSLLRQAEDGQMFVVRGGATVVAPDHDLAESLDRQLASEQSSDSSIRIGLSFRDRTNHYCRTFVVPPEEVAGLACKWDGNWRIEALSWQTHDAAGQYQMAGDQTPAQILKAVDTRIRGEPFDAAAEAAARRAGWQ